MLRPHIAIMTLTLASCTGGQVGEEGGVVCAPVETNALERGETSVLGFSADDVLQNITPAYEGSMQWADLAMSPATVEVAYTQGTIEFQDREWISDKTGNRVEETITLDMGDCPDVVAIDVALSLSTDDGRLAEEWDLTVLAPAADAATSSVAPEAYRGTLDLRDFGPADEDLSSHITFEFQPGIANVRASGIASRIDGDVASAMFFDIGSLQATQP